METVQTCPECGAGWQDDKTCQDHFHQMLYWEMEDQARWVVHHLMVLCYHVQHPSLYSPDGLNFSIHLLVDFMEGRLTTEQARDQNREALDSGNRKFKIKGTPDSQSSYAYPIRWTMTAADVTSAGADHYVESVRAW